MVDLQISLEYEFYECLEKYSSGHRNIVCHIGKQICLTEQHKNYKDEAEINTAPLMRLMSNIMGINTATMYGMDHIASSMLELTKKKMCCILWTV